MLQPGASTPSRRSSTSSLSVPFATPPTSPSLQSRTSQSRIPKPSTTPSSFPGLGSKTRSLSAGSAGSASSRIVATRQLTTPSAVRAAAAQPPSTTNIAAADEPAQEVIVIDAGTTVNTMVGLGFASSVVASGPLERTRSAIDSEPVTKIPRSSIPRRRSTANLSIVTTPNGSRPHKGPTSASASSSPPATPATPATPSTPSISVSHATPPRNGAAGRGGRKPRPASIASPSPTKSSNGSARQSSPQTGGASRLPQRVHRRASLQPSPSSSATASSPRNLSPGKRISPRPSPKTRNTFDNSDNTNSIARLRRSPGLTIDPPPPPRSTSTLRPAPPPLPAKSPLRQLGGTPGRTRLANRRSFVPVATPVKSAAPTTASSSTPTDSPRPKSEATTPDEAGRQTPTSTFAPPIQVPPIPLALETGGYTPAMLTSRSAPPGTPAVYGMVETPTFSPASSYMNGSAPPSAPPDSINNWVVGAQEWMDGGTPTDEYDIPGWHNKELPAVPAHSPVRRPRTPTTPVRPTLGPSPIAARSPSMPTLVGPGRPRGNTESSPSVPRSQTAMVTAGLAPTPQPRPHSMMLPSLPSPTTTPLSRRAHLIREIATTERNHATDLALIRDAYIGRDSPLVGSRPDSQHSSNTQYSSTDHSAASTPGLVDSRPGHARRNSSFGVPVEELRRPVPTDRRPSERGSGHESWAWNGLMSPVRRNLPLNANGSLDQLTVTPPATGSSGSVSSILLPSLSPRFPFPPPATGRRPLTAVDVKAVFLNLTQLATLAEELATEFENALGHLESEREDGSDRLGEVFSQMLPRLRPLYMYYCSRHSAASARLLELQGDPGYAAQLNETWLLVKDRTHAWNLDSMLIKPVQRITKYPLLFEDLLACTTPVHPDYFAIRTAAAGARALALDIDEAKRRKDVITSVIGKSPSAVTLVKDNRGNGPGGRGLLLRRFKKDKSGPLSAGVTPSDPSGPPPEITPYAQAQLKDLVRQLETSDKHVKRLGKEIVEWVETSKNVVRNEIAINLHFLKWYTLDGKLGKDGRTVKVIQYKALLEGILASAWQRMNDEVDKSVMMMLGKLLDAVKNPMMIIDKLNTKASDYGRYVAHRSAKKSLADRMVLQEAIDYVAIHTQLLEELPAFLEGYGRIVEIALAAFTMAQGRYFATFRDKVGEFNTQFLTKPTEEMADGNGIHQVLIDLSSTRGIHRAWLNAFREPNNAMKCLGCTGGDGVQRAATYSYTSRGHGNGNGNGNGSSRSSMSGTPLRHTPSLQSHRRSDESGENRGGRRRSASFTAIQDAARSITSEHRTSITSLMRRNSRNGSATNLSSITGSLNRSMTNLSLLQPLNRSKSRSRSNMSQNSNDGASDGRNDGRHSFGLPRISMSNDQPLFEPTAASSTVRPQSGYYADSPQDYSALGFGEFPLHIAHPCDPVAESWRNSPVLYTCAAVADFMPMELGNHRFQGLYFLPIVAGDLVDVYHEIGRVADLHDFPYSQVGVENDGAVVCRAENGAIGVAMCSFLEPLRV